MLRLDGLGHRRQQVVSQQPGRGRRVVGVQRRLVGQVEPAVRAAVGGVQVHGHVRVVLRQQHGQRPRLGGFQLGAVAIQIEVLRIGALSHAADRAPLAAAVGHVDAFVAVRVVDRVDQQHDRLEPLRALALGNGAQQPQQRFLTLDLSGVDVALDVDPGLPGGQHLFGGRARRANHRQRQRPAFVGVPVRRQVDLGRSGRHRLHERDHVVVPARLGEVARLGPCQRPAFLRRGPCGWRGRRLSVRRANSQDDEDRGE